MVGGASIFQPSYSATRFVRFMAASGRNASLRTRNSENNWPAESINAEELSRDLLDRLLPSSIHQANVLFLNQFVLVEKFEFSHLLPMSLLSRLVGWNDIALYSQRRVIV